MHGRLQLWIMIGGNIVRRVVRQNIFKAIL